MSHSSAPESAVAFTLHALGAALLLVLFLLLVAQALLSPVDLFVHRDYTASYDLLLFAVLGFVFYGFSLSLLRVCPLSVGWGAAYAVSSWLLFVFSFFPTRPTGGMMRRTADLADYEVLRHRVHESFVIFSLFILLAFALVQAAFLWYAFRQLQHRSAHLRGRGA